MVKPDSSEEAIEPGGKTVEAPHALALYCII